jgi:hypothetical protein
MYNLPPYQVISGSFKGQNVKFGTKITRGMSLITVQRAQMHITVLEKLQAHVDTTKLLSPCVQHCRAQGARKMSTCRNKQVLNMFLYYIIFATQATNEYKRGSDQSIHKYILTNTDHSTVGVVE